MNAKSTKTKKKKKATTARLRKAMDPTFRLIWKDNEGQEQSLYIGTMQWGSISPDDAINLEKLIGNVIRDYFNSFLKTKKTKKVTKKNAK